MSAPSDQLVEIGVLGRPHGVRGALRVFLHNQGSTLLEELEKVLVAGADGETDVLEITHFQPGPKHGIARFAGVNSRQGAEELKGALLLVPREMLPPLDEGEFYAGDLIGMNVATKTGPRGTVTASRDSGGIEIVTVTDGETEIEIPLVETFVVDLDIPARKLLVRDIDELPRTPVRPRGSR